MLPTDRIAYSPITERAAAQTAERRPHGGVGDRQCRGMGRDAADAAHGAHAAGRRLADARRAELGLARIWQPGRLLALRQGVRRIRHSGRDRASTARRSPPIRRSCAPRSSATGNSSATASPSAICRKCRTSAPISARSAKSSSRRPASRRAAGSAPASPKPGRHPMCWSRKATIMSPIGCSTISRYG